MEKLGKIKYRERKRFGCETLALAIFLNIISQNSTALSENTRTSALKGTFCSIFSQKETPDDSNSATTPCVLCLICKSSQEKATSLGETYAIDFESDFIFLNLSLSFNPFSTHLTFKSRAPPRIS